MRFKAILWTYFETQSGKYPVKISMRKKTDRDYLALNIFVGEKEFKDGFVKDTTVNYQQYNTEIDNTINKLKELFLKYKCSAKELKRLFEQGDAPKVTLLDFFDSFIKDAKAGLALTPKGKIFADGTITSYKSTYKHFKGYCDEKNSIDFDQIDKNFYEDFCFYLRTKVINSDGEKGLAENSIGKDIKNLISIINKAKDKKITLITEHERNYFIKPESDVDSVEMDSEEMELFMNVDLSEHPHLLEEQERSIIAYCFCLRHSDSINIDPGDIIKDKFISLRAIKTKKPVIVPMKPIVLTILKKHNYKFPKTTNQTSNLNIKAIAKLAKINTLVTITRTMGGKEKKETCQKWELLSTHSLRRGSATDMLISGLDERTVMEIGGWKSIKVFRNSYSKVPAMKRAEIAAQNEFFK